MTHDAMLARLIGDMRALPIGDTGDLVVDNLPLVLWAAKRYFDTTRHMRPSDIVHEGVLGLMHAARKYDPERGEFSTYAVWWIQQYIRRAIMNQDRAIRIPEWRQQEAGDDLPAAYAFSDVAIPDSPQEGMLDDWHDADAASLEDQAETSIAAAAMLRAIGEHLTEREEAVLRLRFVYELTLREIGDGLGLSRERVRQVQDRALRTLRLALMLEGWA